MCGVGWEKKETALSKKEKAMPTKTKPPNKNMVIIRSPEGNRKVGDRQG